MENDATPLAAGFIRLVVRLGPTAPATPGALAAAAGVALDDLGPVRIDGEVALVDVRASALRVAKAALFKLGPVRVAQVNWSWLRLAVGRNHGLSLGQLRKVLAKAEAHPLGRINVNNTHSMIGLHDSVATAVAARLAGVRVNGFNLRPEVLAASAGPGNPEFVRPDQP